MVMVKIDFVGFTSWHIYSSEKRKSVQCNILWNMSAKNVYIFLINLNKPSKSDEFYQETSIDLNSNDKEVDL